jgi:hypothetical protein
MNHLRHNHPKKSSFLPLILYDSSSQCGFRCGYHNSSSSSSQGLSGEEGELTSKFADLWVLYFLFDSLVSSIIWTTVSLSYLEIFRMMPVFVRKSGKD